MPLCGFAQFLVQKKIINEEEAVEALNRQKSRTDAIGKIAIKQKKLDWKQTFEILNSQADSKKLFGEIGIDKGFFLEHDVEELLELQRKCRPPLGELLIEMDILGVEQCESLLKEFLVDSSTGDQESTKPLDIENL